MGWTCVVTTGLLQQKHFTYKTKLRINLAIEFTMVPAIRKQLRKKKKIIVVKIIWNKWGCIFF